jgi:hypothetical protein
MVFIVVIPEYACGALHKVSRADRIVFCTSFLTVVPSTRLAGLINSDVRVLVRRSWKSELYLRSVSKDCSKRYSAMHVLSAGEFSFRSFRTYDTP